MIRRPKPGILQIQPRRPARNMHTHKRANTVIIYARRARRTLRILQITPHKPSNAGMHIPHPRRRPRSIEIPFNQDSSSLRSLRGDNHVGPLDLARGTGVANANYGLWRVHVGEVGTAGHDGGISLPDNLRARGNSNRARNTIDTCIEERNGPSSRGIVEKLLDSVGIVLNTVSGTAAASRALDGGNGEVAVLGLGLRVVFASAEEGCGTAVGTDGAFELVWAGGGVFVAFAPAGDGCGSCGAGEDG